MERTKKEAGHDLGRYAELLFQAEAMRRGLVVYQPVQSYANVDCVVETNRGLVRVQIKARNPVVQHGVLTYKFEHGSRNSSWDSSAVDVLAALCADKGTWMFLPVSEIHGRNAANRSVRPKIDHKRQVKWQDWSIFSSAPLGAPLATSESVVSEVTPEVCLALTAQ